MTPTEKSVARRRLRRLVDAGRRLVRTLDFRDASWVRPLPEVRIRTGRWVPGWTVHGFAAVIAVGCIAVVTSTRAQWIIPLILVGLTLLRPAGAPPVLFALWLGVQVMTSPITAHTFEASGLVFGVHLLAVLLITGADVHPSTRIELRVFVGPLRRLVAIQAFVQPITWATMTLAAGDVTVRWLPVFAALCVVAASWGLVRAVARVPDQV